MSVTERMQALGDNAKSSRQPPLRPRQPGGGDLAAASHFIHDNALTSPPVIEDDPLRTLLIRQSKIAQVKNSSFPKARRSRLSLMPT